MKRYSIHFEESRMNFLAKLAKKLKMHRNTLLKTCVEIGVKQFLKGKKDGKA